MTIVGSGGVSIKTVDYKKAFKDDFSGLDPVIQERVSGRIKDLLKDPRPPGMRFEKLKGYRNPDIYTIHVTGNFKISFEIIGDCAMLRRIAKHDRIDRKP